MTVARITEITAISKKGFDDAVAVGVARANKTLKNVKGAWIKNQEVMVNKGKVTRLQGDSQGHLCVGGLTAPGASRFAACAPRPEAP